MWGPSRTLRRCQAHHHSPTSKVRCARNACCARGTPNVCAVRNDVHQASRARTARVVTCGGLVAPLGGARHIITRLLAKCVARATRVARAARPMLRHAQRCAPSLYSSTARVVTCGGLVAPLGGARHIMTRLLAKCVARATRVARAARPIFASCATMCTKPLELARPEL